MVVPLNNRHTTLPGQAAEVFKRPTSEWAGSGHKLQHFQRKLGKRFRLRTVSPNAWILRNGYRCLRDENVVCRFKYC